MDNQWLAACFASADKIPLETFDSILAFYARVVDVDGKSSN
jgi:hypothetical protein